MNSYEGADSDWHNIIVTYDADNTGAEHSVYLDGVWQSTVASSPELMDTAGLIIGSHRERSDSTDVRNWWGWIDDVGIWDRVLTVEEIGYLQGNPIIQFVGLETDLIGLTDASAAWGDYDNDGDLDILLAGETGIIGPVTAVYENTGAGDFEVAAELMGSVNPLSPGGLRQ